MKRSINANILNHCLNDDSEPQSKVMLVEREENPGGVALVNTQRVGKRSYLDNMELVEGTSTVNTFIHANARNKLDVIGRQMKNLQELMVDVIEETETDNELHNVACNFVKKPGHVYHLYQRQTGQKYFGMLAPEEWQSPHEYLGSFLLESDYSWTPAKPNHGRYEGVNYLKEMFGALRQMQALT